MSGRYRYDEEYDTLVYRLFEGTYARSIELGDVVLDLGSDGSVIGLRVFEASQLFGLERDHLRRVENFRFSYERSDGTISLSIRFTPLSDGEPLLEHHQAIVRGVPAAILF